MILINLGYLEHGQVAQQAGDGAGADQLLGGGAGGSLGVEVELPQVAAAAGEVQQPRVRDGGGVRDVEDGEARRGVRHQPQQRVRGQVLHVEAVEAAALRHRGQRQPRARRRGQEGDLDSSN